jgi:hypothetical protein
MHHWHHIFYQSHAMENDTLNDVYMLLMHRWIQLFCYVISLPAMTLVALPIFGIEAIIPFVFTLKLWSGIYDTG